MVYFLMETQMLCLFRNYLFGVLLCVLYGFVYVRAPTRA